MERHGISFHFRHAMGSHTLVLTDDVPGTGETYHFVSEAYGSGGQGSDGVNRHATLTPFRRPIMTPLGQHG